VEQSPPGEADSQLDKKFSAFYGTQTEGKRPLGRPRSRWEDNTRMDFKEIGLEGVE
jgi:hypothetical protein